MKILVTGRNGQVAQSMLHSTQEDVEIVALGRPELDITDKTSIAKAVQVYKPDIVVNAAAYTAVDKAETEIQEAFAVNRDGAKNVAEVGQDNGLPIIHISTDYVFNGQKENGYKEDDAPGPLNVYGLSKLEGEWAIMEANPNHIILRTAWVYSQFGNNFVKTMIRLAQTHDEINVVSDQWGTPTSADFIANNIIAISKQVTGKIPPQNWRGIFHLVPDGKTNWADFARTIFSSLVRFQAKFGKIPHVTEAAYQTVATRPKNSVLNCDMVKQTFNIPCKNWTWYFNDFIHYSDHIN
ncbi:dTDP-4-dehydrorhamnose reductase [Bartonella apihabitans]|uniref:dTDP-4-dehydrorhamnose reductase n=1 Tax=Bartonella apihabitans TaxID=2750929 RepID=A0A1U9M8I9_9HYPH|nr:dTDP-4-dehydrorhamnose reductase [Bartonella apihabitans]AQT41637.1 dTDP-4-dehydrorhamnose reductase [Bartonella apihabitans]